MPMPESAKAVGVGEIEFLRLNDEAPDAKGDINV